MLHKSSDQAHMLYDESSEMCNLFPVKLTRTLSSTVMDLIPNVDQI